MAGTFLGLGASAGFGDGAGLGFLLGLEFGRRAGARFLLRPAARFGEGELLRARFGGGLLARFAFGGGAGFGFGFLAGAGFLQCPGALLGLGLGAGERLGLLACGGLGPRLGGSARILARRTFGARGGFGVEFRIDQPERAAPHPRPAAVQAGAAAPAASGFFRSA